mmetsp:Transcript_22593/g.47385  ORF Transcript_22593/g.47385 Transcript_22593/m.47385 type:complete len:100 (+) Transcript_22593:259-558(+)
MFPMLHHIGEKTMYLHRNLNLSPIVALLLSTPQGFSISSLWALILSSEQGLLESRVLSLEGVIAKYGRLISAENDIIAIDIFSLTNLKRTLPQFLSAFE